MRDCQRAFLCVAWLGWTAAALAEETRVRLAYAPAPVDNPLKGLVPYAGPKRDSFPHSLEFQYFPLSAFVVGPDQYDWTKLEAYLRQVAGRGHQAIFRVYLEYPGHKNVIPEFLTREGLKVHRYTNTNTQPLPPADVETPDYENPALRRVLRQFIAELGKRYDGDPRIGFLTAGLLGTWGEWHDYPREDLFASAAVQTEVMDAYEAAFRVTPILLRYPRGPKDEDGQAPNARRRFGYHDDSFAWATLDTGKKGDDWFFLRSLKRAGAEALDKWKTQPIGGEIRPEAWGKVFDAASGNKKVQNFRDCVEQTHVTWLMDSGMFRSKVDPERKRRAEVEVRRMGYEFHVPAAAWQIGPGRRLKLRVELENRGVAPFYYAWPAEHGLLAADGTLHGPYPARGKITGLLPGEPPRVWTDELTPANLPAGTYRWLLRVPNPMPGGRPVRFANAEQDRDRAGWLTVGAVNLPGPG